MALQDLTPQLRTRLSRMERAVGLFVMLAAALLAFGFIYYIYTTAKRKGWFKTKAYYFTYTQTATGLKEGDPVLLMGLDVGQITRIDTMPGDDFERNIYVEFALKQPYYDYLWTEGSHVRVATADFLGKRVVEVTKGTGGYPTYIFHPVKEIEITQIRNLPSWEEWKLAQHVYDGIRTNPVLLARSRLSTNLPVLESLGLTRVRLLDVREGQARKNVTAVWSPLKEEYEPFYKTNKYELKCQESPAVTERLETLVTDVEKALPGILALTNQLASALSNTASLTSNLNEVVVSTRPVVSHIASATANLDHPGALGEWLVPTNISSQLEGTLGSAEETFRSANSNLTVLVENLARSLDNLAGITSNLNNQVQSNTNILGSISKTIVDADDLIQGLKHHWLFRSAFDKKKEPKSSPANPGIKSPKQSGNQ